jgi:hypothetical protein
LFYADRVANALRFGDIVRGFLLTSPTVDEPSKERFPAIYEISVSAPDFLVVMDPCCQIGHKLITLASLSHVWPAFYDNPYLKEDLTRINRKMSAEQSVPPYIWKTMPSEEKQKRSELGQQYAFANLFVYEEHGLLPKYTVHRKDGNIETGYYVADFKDLHKIHCDKINSAQDVPLELKVLQLSIESRSSLRNKISSYYGNPPVEDTI